jgi:hypothetical protein
MSRAPLPPAAETGPDYRRPWWLLVNKSAGLITTLHEETHPGEQVFIIRGEPLVQGLGWLTWGPVGAVLVILLLVGLAMALQVNQQGWAIKGLFIAALLILPALAWVGVSALVARLSARHLQAERQAGAQAGTMVLSQKRGALIYSSSAQPEEQYIPYGDIRQVRVAPPLGATDNHLLRLMVETPTGLLILLNERLGTQNQKLDLAQEIQQAVKGHLLAQNE